MKATTAAAPVPARRRANVLAEAGALARLVRSLWAREALRPEAFAQAAADALERRRPHLSLDVETLVEWSLSAERLPRQFSLHSLFGEPPLTLHWDERFVVEAFFWVKPDVTIHDHMFSGAFCVLQGRSLHAVYRFDQERERGGLGFGRLAAERFELLEPGQARAVAWGPRFIHGVWHLSCPSLSLLVRTHQEGDVQRNYFPEGLAVDYQRAKWRPLLEPAVQKRLAFLRFLSRADRGRLDRYARDLLARASFADAFLYLEGYMLGAPPSPARRAVIDQASRRHGPDLALAARALERFERVRAVEWERIADPRRRLRLALDFCRVPAAEGRRLLAELGRARP